MQNYAFYLKTLRIRTSAQSQKASPLLTCNLHNMTKMSKTEKIIISIYAAFSAITLGLGFINIPACNDLSCTIWNFLPILPWIFLFDNILNFTPAFLFYGGINIFGVILFNFFNVAIIHFLFILVKKVRANKK